MARSSFRIDNDLPASSTPNWLTGAGATVAERAVVYASAILGATLVWWFAMRTEPWSWWQTALALLIAADLFGGAVANAASSTKRQYQAPLPPGASVWLRVIRNPTAFAALHVYPVVVVALYPGGSWWWGIGWYAGTVAAVALVTRGVPAYLERPCAMAVFILAVPIALAFPGPPGWSWLPLVFLAKLLVAHAVHEEAYRP